MTEYTTIAIAKQQKKGNIRFKVISLGELKSGTTKKQEPYQKQDAVIKDQSAAMNLTLWNEDIGKLEAGSFYRLENAWWSDYKGDVQLSLGNYYELEKISEAEFANSAADPQQPTIEQSATTPGDPPRQRVSTDDKLDEIIHMLDIIHGMVEPIFKDLVDKQLEASKK